MDTIRSNSEGYIGYTYQRTKLIFLMMYYYDENNNNINKLNSLKFKEEGNEDVDLFNGDLIDSYQLKYHVSDKAKNESFTIDCGLLKVLISHFNNEKIKKIYYEYYFDNNENNEDKISTSLYLFNKIKRDNEKLHLISKYILCVLFNKINISNKKNTIDDKYDEYIDKINEIDNDILKNEIHEKICDFFIDKIKKKYHDNFKDIENKLKKKF